MSTAATCYNNFPILWTDRQTQYNRITVPFEAVPHNAFTFKRSLTTVGTTAVHALAWRFNGGSSTLCVCVLPDPSITTHRQLPVYSV